MDENACVVGVEKLYYVELEDDLHRWHTTSPLVTNNVVKPSGHKYSIAIIDGKRTADYMA
jgi:hypothetical protein